MWQDDTIETLVLMLLARFSIMTFSSFHNFNIITNFSFMHCEHKVMK